jgi:hypothetical protein
MKMGLTCSLLCLSLAGQAHIKIDEPTSVIVTTANGFPVNGVPCGGDGTPTNAVRTVEAGSLLTVSWRETIFHPGHFRLAIAADAGSFVTPAAVVNANNCVSGTIDPNPRLPVLVDGLFPHSAAKPDGRYSTQVRVPATPCERCTLQLLQFRSSHAPPCFHYQCAIVRIVASDAGRADAGQNVDAGRPDAGSRSDSGLGFDAGAPEGAAGGTGGRESEGSGGSGGIDLSEGAGGSGGDASAAGGAGAGGMGGSVTDDEDEAAPVKPLEGSGCQTASGLAVLLIALAYKRRR